jgi:hypothetical protein
MRYSNNDNPGNLPNFSKIPEERAFNRKPSKHRPTNVVSFPEIPRSLNAPQQNNRANEISGRGKRTEFPLRTRQLRVSQSGSTKKDVPKELPRLSEAELKRQTRIKELREPPKNKAISFSMVCSLIYFYASS